MAHLRIVLLPLSGSSVLSLAHPSTHCRSSGKPSRSVSAILLNASRSILPQSSCGQINTTRDWRGVSPQKTKSQRFASPVFSRDGAERTCTNKRPSWLFPVKGDGALNTPAAMLVALERRSLVHLAQPPEL